MNLLDQLREHIEQAAQGLQAVTEPAALPERLMTIAGDVAEIVKTDWQAATPAEREAAAVKIKQDVVEQLIPLASVASMLGVPGILAYTPCQLAGAAGLAHVRGSQPLRLEQLKALLAVVLWGKLGQLLFVNLAELLKPVVTPPLIGLAVLPFVQRWTRAILDEVDSRERRD